ncbi:Hypothetical protein EAG7_01497 [Klebsiella aerogenes]|nr:Hypothetical protein EAG7_01497 [Klebsiella aerogenes]CCG29956.1 hypothetical protein [Klebsiella aerogenes EA1509E]
MIFTEVTISLSLIDRCWSFTSILPSVLTKKQHIYHLSAY